MRWLERLLTRRLSQPCFDAVPARERGRLYLACRQLTEAEEAIRQRLGLCVRPRLALVDEELGVIITPPFRERIESEHDGAGRPR